MNNINILGHLLSNRGKKLTINQISKDLNINYRIAHTKIKELEKEGLIIAEKAGKSLLCSLSGNFDEKIFCAEYQRMQKIIKNNDLKTIRKRFMEAKQNFILLLFGSYAKGAQTKNSDIDLLAISENEKELAGIAELIPKKIHLSVVSYKSFLQMNNSKELTVVSEALKNNIILIGIENYYRLIKND